MSSANRKKGFQEGVAGRQCNSRQRAEIVSFDKDLFQNRGSVYSLAVVRKLGAAFEKNALVCLFILSFTQLLTLVIVTVPPSSAVAPPQFDGFVVLERGGGDDVLGGVAGRAQNDVGVAQQFLHYLLRLQVPDVNLRARIDSICKYNTIRLKWHEKCEKFS